MEMVSATKVALKKNASSQCTVPVLWIFRLEKLAPAVCNAVSMTLARKGNPLSQVRATSNMPANDGTAHSVLSN
jgi:hypothetical protein